ncbi:hypothetical protein K0M31_010823, partial [Melipona bicolor]
IHGKKKGRQMVPWTGSTGEKQRTQHSDILRTEGDYPSIPVSISDDYRACVRASPPLIGLTVLTVSLVDSP